MEILNEKMLIEKHLSNITPVLTQQIEELLCAAGFDVTQEGYGLDTSLNLKFKDKEIKFYMYNLFLEIATIDRDETPLRFDYKLENFDYFAEKAAKLISSKLAILFKLLGCDNIDKALEDVKNMAGQYERIRIITFDNKGGEK